MTTRKNPLGQQVSACRNTLFGLGTSSDPIAALENLLNIISPAAESEITQEARTLVLYMMFHGYIHIQENTITPPETYQKREPKKTACSAEKRKLFYSQLIDENLTTDTVDQLVALFTDGEGDPLAGILLAQIYSSGAFKNPTTGNVIERDTRKCNDILESLHALCKRKEPKALKYRHTIELLTYLHESQHSTNFEKKSEALQRLKTLEIEPDFIHMDLIPHTQNCLRKKTLFKEIAESIVSIAQKLRPSSIHSTSALHLYMPKEEPFIADIIGALFSEIPEIETELRESKELDHLIRQVDSVKGDLGEEGRAYLSNLLWTKTEAESSKPYSEYASFTP